MATAPPPIRLAILEADTPFGEHRAKYGSYGGVFVSLLYKAADASNVPRERLKITGWDVVNVDGAEEGEEEEMGGEFDFKRTKGIPRMEDVDAVLITGSRRWTSLPFAWDGKKKRKEKKRYQRHCWTEEEDAAAADDGGTKG